MRDTPLLHHFGINDVKLVRQTEISECGLACLAMIAGAHGVDCDLSSLRQLFPISLKGMTAATILEIGNELGLLGRGFTCHTNELSKLQLPAMLHWQQVHFVVLKSVSKRSIVILDPAVGERKVSWQEATELFSGVALEFTQSGEFTRRNIKNSIKISSMLPISTRARSLIFKSVVVSVPLELIVVITPFYSKIVIDQVVAKGDVEILFIITCLFLLFGIYEYLAFVIRGLCLQLFAAGVSFDMRRSLFRHLIRLPLDWFQRRHIGDIQSRFAATNQIKNTLSANLIATVFDSILALVTGLLMYWFSAKLALIVFIVILLYLFLSSLTLSLQRKVANDLILNETKEHTLFLESIRGCQTIKLSGGENQRTVLWQNLASKTLNSEIRSSTVTTFIEGANRLIMRLVDLGVIFVAAREIIDAQLTVGAMFAFLAYKAVFVQRATALIKSVTALGLLDIDVERIADIATSPEEKGLSGTVGLSAADFRGDFEVRNLRYRYSYGERETLTGVTFAVKANSYVAITGTSGGGKSTLVKLLVGLLSPNSGEVLFSGHPASSWGSVLLRQEIGVVMQDDALLAGTLLENISSFAETVDIDWAKQCCEVAQIQNDIEQMPMGFKTLVGDMGSTLSGGQKARLFLARALYKRPKILILDEGTANLDQRTERAITEALTVMPCTKVVIAHRQQTIEAASEVWSLERGQLLLIRAFANKPSQ
jgi:ATP-binding cassette subfamily B protein RaxB